MAASPSLPPLSVPLADPAMPITDAESWQQQHPSWLYAALTAGEIVDATGVSSRHPVALDPIGAIELPDGRLVACDPYLAQADAPAFIRPLAAGAHPVLVAVTTIADLHRRVLAAVLLAGDGPIVRWESARTVAATADPGAPDEPAELGAYYGYPVDAGTGCFAAPAAMPALAAAMQADAGRLEDPVSVALDLTVDGAAVAPLGEAGPSVAAFRSGWGDGVYPTWLGLSATGSVVLAMTDFLLFADPWEPAANLPGVQATVRPASHAAPPPERAGDYAGRITADESAAALARADQCRPHPSGFWARLFGHR